MCRHDPASWGIRCGAFSAENARARRRAVGGGAVAAPRAILHAPAARHMEFALGAFAALFALESARCTIDCSRTGGAPGHTLHMKWAVSATLAVVVVGWRRGAAQIAPSWIFIG